MNTSLPFNDWRPVAEPERSEQFENKVDQDKKLEWWDSDKLDALGWGLAFIWGGFVLLLNNYNINETFPWWDGLGVFFTGAGIITITIAIIRFFTSRNQGKVIAGLIFGLILLGIGLGNAFSQLWPIALFVIGVYIIRGVIIKK